jgi:hypothetical protein
MESIEILGYVGALLIGLVLGLIGGGGSIITVPILVYALAFNPVLATAYSLFVVGATSLVGAVKNMMKGMVDFKTAIIFAVPAFIAVYLTRAYLIPAIPEELFTLGGFLITKNIAIMLFFALIMLLASVSMIRNKSKEPGAESIITYNYPLIIIEGLVVGFIPALVLLAKLPMKKAVATSLFIIAIKSLIGFLGDVKNLEIDWTFLLSFTAVSIVGIFIGIWLNKFIDGKKLKKAFGWFVLIMGFYIIYKELIM